MGEAMSSTSQEEDDAERVATAAWHDDQARRLLPIVVTAIAAAMLAGPLLAIVAPLYPNLPVLPLWIASIAGAWAVRGRRESHLRAAAGLRVDAAERIVEHAIKTNAPLVLYLRQFDLEREDLEAPGDLVSFGDDQIHRRSVESALVEAVDSTQSLH